MSVPLLEPSPFITPTVTVDRFKLQLIQLLDIPADLTGPGDMSLKIAYKKYKAYCSECTQPYKHTSDLRASDDPTSTLEGNSIPVSHSANLGQSSSAGLQRMEVDDSAAQDVTMIVVDGIVFGPSHCAYDDCTTELANARGGVFCALHEQEHGATCHVRGCENLKVHGTNACQAHQEIWKRYLSNHSRKQLSGFRRMLYKAGENLPWQSAQPSNAQPHDEPTPIVQYATYFMPR